MGLHLRFVFRCSITANNVWDQITISDFINDRRCKYDSYFIGYFGFIQLVVGLMINGIQLSKQKRYLDSINESYAWLGILFGLALLVVGKLVVKMKAYLQQVRF